MKKRIKKFLLERIKRLNFIKTELNRLVGKSLFLNTYNNNINSITTLKHVYYKKIKYNTISNFRLYCMFNLSPKLVNKKYRLSRFSLNKIAKNGNISGFIKKGW